jgi:hypothetical protein
MLTTTVDSHHVIVNIKPHEVFPYSGLISVELAVIIANHNEKEVM